MATTEPLTWSNALTSWQLSPWDGLVVALAAGYLAGVVRYRRGGGRWPVRHSAAFLAGLLALVLAVNSAIGVYSESLTWVHMVQHLVLIMAVPILLIAGRPLALWATADDGTTSRRLTGLLNSRAAGWLTHPATSFVYYTAVLIVTHLTVFAQLRLEHEWLRHFEIVLYLTSGYLLFLPVLGNEPLRWKHFPHPLRVVLLMAGMLPDTLVGVVLMMAPNPIAPAYRLARPDWGPALLTDQHLAGAIMWFFGDATMAVLALITVGMWLRSRGPEAGFGSWLETARRGALARTASGPAPALSDSTDVDADERALADYNAMLARLHGNAGPQHPSPPRSDGEGEP
ncbi:cytochrome c oxidase assembly protein [Actinopolyspora erythraea]|uniref:Cytochrome c oxidase assembly protein n=1 Tax=Actinopolyspora erythraea TaxID=414996 RepID=A0A223RXG4_9ACTN|nr:cytochrome c oxidase assembly protein [Actinopolyspora erythraea]ASU80571.1 cytochrome c oxidase assembly protein [Actinopolyspora erythraea]